MSTNAFYQSYGAMQNALGDPRGDAERRAMQQRQMQMQEMEFAAKQQDAQRQAAERQAVSARGRAVYDYRTRSMYPNGQGQQPMPQGGQTPAYQVQGQAPMAAPQPIAGPAQQPMQQSPQMDAQGREIDMVTVTGERRGPTPTHEDELDFLMRDAYKRNDIDGFNQYFEARRSNMSAQEKLGRQKIAIAASEVVDLTTHEARVNAVRQFMVNNNINPEDTKIDDYFNDPDALMFELEMAIGLGAPDKATEESVSTHNYGERQRLEQQFEPASALNLGNRQVLYDGRGNQIRSYGVGVTPDNALDNNTQRQIALINDRKDRAIAALRSRTDLTEAQMRAETDRLDRESREDISALNRQSSERNARVRGVGDAEAPPSGYILDGAP